MIYTRFSKNKLHKFDRSQFCLPDKSWNTYWDTVSAKYYRYNPEGEPTEVKDKTTIDVNELYYVIDYKEVYKDAERNESKYGGNTQLYEFKTSYREANDD
jgi:hypothetical protein